MTNVILVLHILVSIVLIIVVLMQRSEGGALGIGGGGGGAGGGLVSGRGVAGVLVRTTMIFGAIFFITSIGLTTLASRGSDGRTEIERDLQEEFLPPAATDDLGIGDVDDILNPESSILTDPLLAEPTPAQPETSDEPADPLAEPTEN